MKKFSLLTVIFILFGSVPLYGHGQEIPREKSYTFLLENNIEWKEKLKDIEKISNNKIETSIKEVNLVDVITTENKAKKIENLPFVQSYNTTSMVTPPKVS
ncbi:hypothetical protein [Staphylococcus americanisciuri]|uniref:Uncharacterized protein n=1 Tax=Staphylococcus americanisciuri TaxID=2973940 RepID=A0ABT2F382_9STAP|nr:hypothetical protein [Staphylococcus americanisciuri]MCS4486919.1 hypothetical protein [Staphylococcus americanisciuri]